jgi:ribosome maturation factor RimP
MAEHELKGSDNYLVSVLVKPGNKIKVFIDNDNDVSVDDCVKLSRAIEGQLDRDAEDFELMVSSAGLDQPFSLPRQYKKYLNRKINIQLPEGNRFDAILTAVDENSITFKKLIKKGKSKKLEEGPEQKLSLEEINEIRPGIQF